MSLKLDLKNISFSDGVEIKYIIKKGELFLEWNVTLKNGPGRGILKESALISIFDLGYMNYTKDNKQILIFGFFSTLHIEVDFFKKMTKDFLDSYGSNIQEIKDKYINPYESISKKHQKLINENRKYEKIIDFYTEGYLMNTEKQFLSNDEDKFFAKFDFRGKGIGGKSINNTILKMLREFPRTNKRVIVWRALKLKSPPKEGEVITQNIVFSTSLNPYVSMDFMDRCCLFKITLPPRYPALFINKFLEWQDEVILYPSEITVEKMHTVKKKNINKFLEDPIFPHLRTYGTNIEKTSKNILIFECSIKLIDT